jgi:DNA helicase HerA-like ATPase
VSSDFEIGRVVAVDTAQVTIELNKDLRALTRSTYEGIQEVGCINSYVIIPVGAYRLVAMLTRVVIVEEAEIKADRTMVTLPAARRLMKATLIGTIIAQSFKQGVSLFPVLDNVVLLPTKNDLDVIFDIPEITISDIRNPGYCIQIGESSLFEGRQVHIHPDLFFGKHSAILGSTGSGKSCTIASIIQSILSHDEIKRTTFVILDTNGEYRSAFQHNNKNGSWEDMASRRCLFIPSDSKDESARLVVPYWFMNSNDFTRLFKAAPNVQRPVLLDALTMSRMEAQPKSGWRRLRDDIILEANAILASSRSHESRDARIVRQLCTQIVNLLNADGSIDALRELEEIYEITKNELTGPFVSISDIAREGIRREGTQYESYDPIGADKRRRIEELLQPLLGRLTVYLDQDKLNSDASVTSDTPVFFNKHLFRDRYLDEAINRHEALGGRTRDNCATMLLRICHLLEDKRFDFLFGPRESQIPDVTHSLATFLRDVLGMPSASVIQPPLRNEEVAPKRHLPFYDRQRVGTDGYHVVIIDLSLLASEVLENVTAMIGRLIIEFLQRLGELGENMRGVLPVVLVLEEAQNYIKEQSYGEEKSISCEVFERIAREGRKYGLGLVISSQRPSELSKTVLSQCSSFIVHRLQNPGDLRYFKDIVPGIFEGLLDQLPSLAPQTALVLGECVRAPALVRIRDARPLPHSRDPKFYEYWVSSQRPDIPVEDVCDSWEGKLTGDAISNS